MNNDIPKENHEGPQSPANIKAGYRRRRRQGERHIRIPLHVTEVDTLIRMGLLTEERRQDDEALQTAILSIVYRALDDAEAASRRKPKASA
jgi:hypothetical protein